MTVFKFNEDIQNISKRYKTLKHQLVLLLTLLLVLVMLLPNNVMAGDDEPGLNSNGTNVGTTAAAFLEIGAGTRAQAMGGAFVSISEDGVSSLRLPARLTTRRKLFSVSCLAR